MPVMRCHPLDACRTGSKRACDERSRWLLLVVGLGGLEPAASSLSASRAHRCADRRYCRWRPTVRGQVMRSYCRPYRLADTTPYLVGKVCQQSIAGKAMGLPVGAAAPSSM